VHFLLALQPHMRKTVVPSLLGIALLASSGLLSAQASRYPNLTRTRSEERGGPDLSLEIFLTSRSLFDSGLVTGYFGMRTHGAVRPFECAQEHEQEQRRSGDEVSTSEGAILNASPTSGPTPLTVTFSATYFGTTAYSVVYGDGSLGPTKVCDFNCSPAVQSVSFKHTYHKPGTYTATFTVSNGSRATATIVVRGGF
jgi:PKD domain